MNRIKELRIELNMTQEDLGKKLQVQKAAVSKYETGRAQLSSDLIIQLCSIFNVSSDYLLGLSNLRNSTINEPAKSSTIKTDNAIADEIYSTLIDIGFINDGDEITDNHLEVLTKILAPQIDYAKFQLEMKKLEDKNKKNDL